MKRYNLKWITGNESLIAMENFFNPEMSLDAMLQKVGQMIAVLQPVMGLIVRHSAITGLRPAEAVESVKLIANKETLAKYYNPERQTLEHFRFKEQFLRQTKKAYVSFVTLDNLQPIANLGRKRGGLYH